MTASQRLTKMSALTGMVLQAEQAALARLQQREADLIARLADLQAQRHRPTHEGPALIAGADLRWHRWIDQRREIMNRELAQVRALTEAQRHRLRLAFGRDQATQALAAKAQDQAKQIAARRTDYTS